MGIFSRVFGSGGDAPSTGDSGGAKSETLNHLREFISTREGCEAFIEPATGVTQTTMVIVAGTGEWTRRRVPNEKTARKVAQQLGVIAYDVNLSGYPSRKRDWDAKKRK